MSRFRLYVHGGITLIFHERAWDLLASIIWSLSFKAALSPSVDSTPCRELAEHCFKFSNSISTSTCPSFVLAIAVYCGSTMSGMSSWVLPTMLLLHSPGNTNLPSSGSETWWLWPLWTMWPSTLEPWPWLITFSFFSQLTSTTWSCRCALESHSSIVSREAPGLSLSDIKPTSHSLFVTPGGQAPSE